MRRYLPRLFGGPLDGEARALDPETRRRGRYVAAVRTERARAISHPSLPMMGSGYTEAHYRRHLIAPGSMCAELEVFAHEDMPLHELHRRVWDHLIDRAGASYA